MFKPCSKLPYSSLVLYSDHTTHHASPRLPLSLLYLTHSRDKTKHVFPMADQRHGAKWIMTIMTYSAPKDCSVSIKIWKSQLTSVNSNMARADPWSETEQPMIFPKAVVTTGGWTSYASRHLGTKWVTSLQKEPRKQALYKKIPECGREGEMPYCDRNVFYPFLSPFVRNMNLGNDNALLSW